MTVECEVPGQELPIRVLLVEDNHDEAEFVTMMLDRSPEINVHVKHVMTLGEAVAAAHRSRYDVVLLDLGLPDSTGTEGIVRLKACSPNMPIVVLTGDDRHDTAIAAIDSGAQDYLPKQHLVVKLLTRMTRHSIARHRTLMQAQSEALIDGLTGLANRRGCDAEIDRRLSDFKRLGHPFCVALIDIDHFKQFNDRWGHETGDQVIQAVANVLADTTRDFAHVARYGGEEFVITFPQIQMPAARHSVMRCQRAVSNLVVGEQQLQTTVSIGYAEVTEHDDWRSLFARTDEALYAAKRSGRNRCMPNMGEADGAYEILNDVGQARK